MIKYSPGEQKKIIIDYIKKHPIATHRNIKKATKLHVSRYFKGGLKEVFKEAKIKIPRNFNFKTREERRKIIIDFIKKHPVAGGHTISKKTKINLASAFKNIEEAYKFSGIKYPRKNDGRTKKEKEQLIIQAIKKNPLITTQELTKKLKLSPYKYFKNLKEIYKKIGIGQSYINGKRRIKKAQQVIGYIKQNPLSTQREINKFCKTHVQELFKKGIFEAYEKAGIKFPFERLKIYGIGLKNIRKRAKDFEEEIAIKLSGYGKVNKFVKTKRGVADIVLERKNKRAIIEIKDYRCKDISKSQINQLLKYLEDCNCHLGILICHKKPRKDKFLIGKNKIVILEKDELEKIQKLI